jgi:hypothetical protein
VGWASRPPGSVGVSPAGRPAPHPGHCGTRRWPVHSGAALSPSSPHQGSARPLSIGARGPQCVPGPAYQEITLRRFRVVSRRRWTPASDPASRSRVHRAHRPMAGATLTGMPRHSQGTCRTTAGGVPPALRSSPAQAADFTVRRFFLTSPRDMADNTDGWPACVQRRACAPGNRGISAFRFKVLSGNCRYGKTSEWAIGALVPEGSGSARRK